MPGQMEPGEKFENEKDLQLVRYCDSLHSCTDVGHGPVPQHINQSKYSWRVGGMRKNKASMANLPIWSTLEAMSKDAGCPTRSLVRVQEWKRSAAC